MEELAVYTRDPDYPLVCLDETSKQLLAETRVPIPMKAGATGAFRLRVRAQRHRQPRFPTSKPSSRKFAAWEHDRNANRTKANWHFTTPNARIKLKHLYPSI
jgi:hypothetical protein